jgi:hypothetical protein
MKCPNCSQEREFLYTDTKTFVDYDNKIWRCTNSKCKENLIQYGELVPKSNVKLKTMIESAEEMGFEIRENKENPGFYKGNHKLTSKEITKLVLEQ